MLVDLERGRSTAPDPLREIGAASWGVEAFGVGGNDSVGAGMAGVPGVETGVTGGRMLSPDAELIPDDLCEGAVFDEGARGDMPVEVGK